ncbi:MAG TPA: MBOAT family protein, partial [Mobilitalea sp.]|nr:MBOAT family protein [Mobilitalea sp.]
RTFDCYRNVGTTFRMYGTILTKWNATELFGGGIMELGLTMADYAVLILGVVLLLFVSLKSRALSFRDKLAARPLALRYAVYFMLLLAVLIFGAYGIGYDSNQFIYSRF